MSERCSNQEHSDNKVNLQKTCSAGFPLPSNVVQNTAFRKVFLIGTRTDISALLLAKQPNSNHHIYHNIFISEEGEFLPIHGNLDLSLWNYMEYSIAMNNLGVSYIVDFCLTKIETIKQNLTSILNLSWNLMQQKWCFVPSLSLPSVILPVLYPNSGQSRRNPISGSWMYNRQRMWNVQMFIYLSLHWTSTFATFI